MEKHREHIVSIIGEDALAKLEEQHFRVVLDLPAKRAAMTDEDRFREAVLACAGASRVSVSFVQRCLRLGYGDAARIINRMEAEGLCSAPDVAGRRGITTEGHRYALAHEKPPPHDG